MVEKEYKDPEQNVWKTEKENDFVCGLFKAVNDNVGVNNAKVYILEQENKEVISVWGSTVLDSQMELRSIGEDVKIIYLGQKESEKRKGKKYHDYKVQVAI